MTGQEDQPKSLREQLDELAFRLTGLEAALNDGVKVEVAALKSRVARLEEGMLALYQGDREKVSEVMRRKLR